jgi:hypothetical protein
MANKDIKGFKDFMKWYARTYLFTDDRANKHIDDAIAIYGTIATSEMGYSDIIMRRIDNYIDLALLQKMNFSSNIKILFVQPDGSIYDITTWLGIIDLSDVNDDMATFLVNWEGKVDVHDADDGKQYMYDSVADIGDEWDFDVDIDAVQIKTITGDIAHVWAGRNNK